MKRSDKLKVTSDKLGLALRLFIFLLVTCHSSLITSGQTVRRVPVQMINGQFVVDVPVTPAVTNAPNTITNIAKIYVMPDNTIDPSRGARLLRNFSSPITITLAPFPTGSYTTFYYRNVNGNLITWPPGIVWLSPPPTNQARGVVLFESVGAEIWASQ